MTLTATISIVVARVLLFMPFMTLAGCIPILIEEWAVGATQVSTIVSGFFFSYAFSLLLFSWLGDHIGAKRSVVLSALATAIASGAFALFATDFTTSLIFYSLIGLSQGGVYTPLIALFRENTPANTLGTAIGLLIASTSIGYAASIATTGAAIGIGGWRLAFLVTGMAPALGRLILLAAISRIPNRIHPREGKNAFFQQLRQNRDARNLVAGYTMHNWELIGMWSWGPALIAASFVLAGSGVAAAAQASAGLLTILHLGDAVAAFTMGNLSDRLGRRTILIWTAAIATVFSFSTGWFVDFSPYFLAALLIVYSFFAIGDSPVLSSALAERVDPAYLGAMLATRSLIGFIAAAISPIAVGWTIDTLRAAAVSETIVWGVAFATLGFGGLMAVYYARKLSD
jgi:MFS family permease